ncbi:MAG: response regulator transcription factor [Chloroflexi bacterium]|nr:response regulator transcription factor [Chloroflexota bacterium]
MKPTTIVIADDHQVIRHSLHILLEAEPDFRIIGEASDGVEATHTVKSLQPDVLVLDMVMSGLNGIEVARKTREESPHTRIVILSMYDNEAYVMEALRAGAGAYVLKRSTSEDLVRAIRETMDGRRYLSGALSQRLLQSPGNGSQGQN